MYTDYDNEKIDRYTLSDNGDGTFTPIFDGLFADTGRGSGDLMFMTAGAFAGDLLLTDWNDGEVAAERSRSRERALAMGADR